MSYRDIRFELEDEIATITLDRPDHLNSYTGRMGEELGEAYRECDGNDGVRVVVLTGSGRAFCAGADMSGGGQTFESQTGMQGFSAAGVSPAAFEIRKPVIAAMNGHAVGIGLTLALQCDMRIAALDGKYGILQVRRGVMPDGYSHWTLSRIAGLANAADLLLTGRKIDGEEALRLGLVSRALPADEVLPAATGIARDMARHTAPLSVAITKRLLWESMNLTPGQVEERETQLHHHIMGRPDAIEGGLAYVERREPKWSLSVSRDWPEWPAD
jgi:enoyl-CoA hydratase/carnithine racemase